MILPPLRANDDPGNGGLPPLPMRWVRKAAARQGPPVTGVWPDWGYRVVACRRDKPEDCLVYGPAVEHLRRCADLANLADRDLPEDRIWCRWLKIPEDDREPEHQRIYNAIPDRAIQCKTAEIHHRLLQIATRHERSD